MFSTRFDEFDLVIFDRDGVLNEIPRPPSRYILKKSELIFLDSTISLIITLQNSGKNVVIATNQQCVGKGLLSQSNLDSIHNEINLTILQKGGKQIDFFVCPHLEGSNCSCRKPKPGLLELAIKKYNAAKTRTIFIGDQVSDEQSANAAGIQFIYVNDL